MASTGVITYNVNERGRKFRGVDRNFDTAALAKLINGGETQERVKHGDMVGYYGHWPRIKFGMNPTEGGIVDGKQVALEPAVRTTLLRAKPDGTIEHETEFLPNPSGKLAERLFNGKMGGFSSAIDHKRCGDLSFPLQFYGFDYVLEPNYTTNRGYDVALDAINGGGKLAIFDAVECMQMFDALNSAYSQLQAAFERQADTCKVLSEENEDMLSMLASGFGGKKSARREMALDGIQPASLHLGDSGRLAGADRFLSANLIEIEAPKPTGEEAENHQKTDGLLSRMFGIGR
jgi:hypothetical protein